MQRASPAWFTSRRFADDTPRISVGEPRHLVIDSTGLQLFGRGAWHADKHGERSRSWRKLHLAIDAETGEIVASNLIDNGNDDAGEVPFLLAQVEGPIGSVTADGVYDGELTYQAVEAKQSHPPPNVVIPPRVTAIPSGRDTDRDRHIAAIAERGRMTWQKATGYVRRNLVETAIGCYKAIIGPRLRSRNWRAQRAETVIGVEVLNLMIRVAKPVLVRVL